MRVIFALGAIATLLATVYIARIVLHGFTDHEHLDIFHLVVTAIGLAFTAALARRALYRSLGFRRPPHGSADSADELLS